MLSPSLQTAVSAELSPSARRGLTFVVLALHGAAVWALLQVAEVRRTIGDIAPITVAWIAAPALPTPPPAAPPQRPPVAPVAPRPQPAIATVATPAPVPPAFVAAPSPAPEPPVTAAEPPAVITITPPAPPPQPAALRTLAITAVEYLTPPILNYPIGSRRMQEQGQVHVRVLVDAQGAPQQLSVLRSSSYPRLDDAAIATVRATRFRPYAENGTPRPFWVVMPLVFELES